MIEEHKTLQVAKKGKNVCGSLTHLLIDPSPFFFQVILLYLRPGSSRIRRVSETNERKKKKDGLRLLLLRDAWRVSDPSVTIALQTHTQFSGVRSHVRSSQHHRGQQRRSCSNFGSTFEKGARSQRPTSGVAVTLDAYMCMGDGKWRVCSLYPALSPSSSPLSATGAFSSSKRRYLNPFSAFSIFNIILSPQVTNTLSETILY